MPRLALFNMTIGFFAMLIASAGGAILSSHLTELFAFAPEQASTWKATLQASSHGHFSLFGMMEICFGLTLPYSAATPRVKKIQTAGFLSGLIAMGPMLLIRAYQQPNPIADSVAYAIGILLVFYFLSMLSHTYYLCLKWLRGAQNIA